jgi:hypothetical protein
MKLVPRKESQEIGRIVRGKLDHEGCEITRKLVRISKTEEDLLGRRQQSTGSSSNRIAVLEEVRREARRLRGL